MARIYCLESVSDQVLKLREFRYKRISQNPRVEVFLKEFVRKSIHIASSFTVLLAHYFYELTLGLIICGILFYTLCEILRLNGKRVPIISSITQIASRKADEGKFVLGPLTLGFGLLLSLLLFQTPVSSLAIFALTFGDGFAGLIGRLYGQMQFKPLQRKTFVGSFACFFSVFLASIFILKSFPLAVILAFIATIVEALPLKNLDNIAIPLVVGFSAVLLGI